MIPWLDLRPDEPHAESRLRCSARAIGPLDDLHSIASERQAQGGRSIATISTITCAARAGSPG